jgi:6-phosphogluconolactonase
MKTLADIYVATQQPGATGIARATFDWSNGALSEFETVAPTPDPGFLALHPARTHLYVANSGTPGGVTSFRIEHDKLISLNFVQSQGRGPSYISVDHTGRYVLEANYGGAFIEVVSINESGALGAQTAFVQHSGHGVHPERQTRAYPHWFGTDPSNRFALVNDLGTDRVYVYRFDQGVVTPNDPPFVRTHPGSGPRHLAWHPNGKIAYLIQELSNEITSFAWNGQGGLTPLHTVSTIAADFVDTNTAAEIAVHGSGRFLVASNRGEDSLVVFALEADGRLELRQRVSSGGKTPRYFAFDPSQQWLLVTHQGSDSVALFRVDSGTGALSPMAQRALGKPAGVVFVAQ